MEKYTEFIDNIVSRYKHLGSNKLVNGTELIGHVPHIAPQAHLHILFCPLNNEEIEQMTNMLGLKILPSNLIEFYSKFNGISLFSDSINIYGLRNNFNRGIEDVWQPFSILTPNKLERIKDSKKEYLYIGGYRYDGSKIYLDTISNKVYRCSRESSKPLNTWENFGIMLLSESKRIDLLFDENGRKLNPRIPTTPLENNA